MGFFDDRMRSKDRYIAPTLPPCPVCGYTRMEFDEVSGYCICPKCGFSEWIAFLRGY